MLQATQILLVVAVMVVAGVKAGMYGIKSRIDIWPIVVGVKSLVFLSYELSTEWIQSLRRWGNFKAYMIINIIEAVFWFAAVVITNMGVKVCYPLGGSGSCTISGVLVVLSVTLFFVAFTIAFMGIRTWRHWERNGVHPDEAHHSNLEKGGLANGNVQMVTRY